MGSDEQDGQRFSGRERRYGWTGAANWECNGEGGVDCPCGTRSVSCPARRLPVELGDARPGRDEDRKRGRGSGPRLATAVRQYRLRTVVARPHAVRRRRRHDGHAGGSTEPENQDPGGNHADKERPDHATWKSKAGAKQVHCVLLSHATVRQRDSPRKGRTFPISAAGG